MEPRTLYAVMGNGAADELITDEVISDEGGILFMSSGRTINSRTLTDVHDEDEGYFYETEEEAWAAYEISRPGIDDGLTQ